MRPYFEAAFYVTFFSRVEKRDQLFKSASLSVFCCVLFFFFLFLYQCHPTHQLQIHILLWLAPWADAYTWSNGILDPNHNS